MVPFLVLLLSLLVLRGLGAAGVGLFASWPTDAAYALAVMLLMTASVHFTKTKDDLMRMVPAAFPFRAQIVAITGALELLGAVGLVIPETRGLAGVCLALLFLAMFPANVNGALRKLPLRGRMATPLWLRTPMQLVFIVGGALWATLAVWCRKETSMPALFTVVKFVHILLAIIAFGFNATYAIWIVRAQRNPEHLDFALRGVKFLDDYFANPAYLLLLVSGLTMVALVHYQLTTFWLAAALVLWLVAIALGYGVYTPTLRRQIQTLASSGAQSAEYQALATRGTVVGITLAVLVLLILVMMVFKPGF